MLDPGLGECMILPSPTYMPTWLILIPVPKKTKSPVRKLALLTTVPFDV